MRILRDGRVRFSEWCFPNLSRLGILADGTKVTVERCGMRVLYLSMDKERIVNGCFDFLLSEAQLRDAVSDLRKAEGGLERWLVPCLEFTHAHLSASNSRPEFVRVLSELLTTCRDLPVAEQWKKARTNVFAELTPGEASEETSSTLKPRPKAKPPAHARKRLSRK